MFYEQLVHEYNSTKMAAWLANDRLHVLQEDDGSFGFCTAPIDRSRAQISGENGKIMNRTLFFLKDAEDPRKQINKKIGVDYISTDSINISLPYHLYGAIINATCDLIIEPAASKNIFHESTIVPAWQIFEKAAILKDGSYFVCVKTQGSISAFADGIIIHSDNTTKTTISFYNDYEKAKEIALDAYNNSESLCAYSRDFWEAYFNSCPISETNDFEFKIRQYWHWWSLLVNVSNVEFNQFPIYMAPDRHGWFGTWSNDGPETMAALSLTNQKDVARKIIVNYIKTAINDNGIHAWYLSNDGIPCYGRKNDVGCLSQGVPNIVHTVNFYIRQTDDKSILDEVCGNATLYEKLKLYVKTIYKTRDLDCDGLIEWRNLWETGWDDKLGCFFKGASIEEWINQVTSKSNEEIERFYTEKCYPVISVVEQVYLLWALISMKSIASLKNDIEMNSFCDLAEKKLRKSFNEKCWDENSGFYFDYNVRENCKATAKSLDCLYWLFFEKDSARIERIYSYLDNPNCFGLLFTPMQSCDVEGFSPTGYWSGGHWPREMSYLGLGLSQAGKNDKAREILKKAIMCTEGSLVCEVLNPYTGEPTTGISRMAYNILDVVALLCIDGKISWL